MGAFQIDSKNGSILHIWDNRYDHPVDITDGTGRFAFLEYSLINQDIDQQDKQGCIPFLEQFAGYDSDFHNDDYGSDLEIRNEDDCLRLILSVDSSQVDGAGIYLPFNFISRKNGVWQEQFTVSSPYHTVDGKHHLFYLARPDGKGIACILENEIDCYQIHYSPYLSGHFIRGITFWAKLDKAYGRPLVNSKKVILRLVPVSSYKETIELASSVWGCCAAWYDISSAAIGQRFSFSVYGNFDSVQITSPSGTCIYTDNLEFTPTEYGFHRITPFCDGVPGLDCTFFAFDSLEEMYDRATLSIVQDPEDVIGKTIDGKLIYRPPYLEYRNYKDYNLCEHTMWCLSALKNLQRGNEASRIHRDVQNLLCVLHPENDVRLTRCSYQPERGYHTYGDHRIQEAYNGVNILLAAFDLYQDRKLLTLAKTVLWNRLQQDMPDDGGIFRHGSDGATAEIADYTTVTGLVFPIVDMALLLQTLRDPDWKWYRDKAIAVADYVVSRGFDFPTEGGTHPECNPEVEEGSMSCSALTILYVYHFLEKKPEYISFAGKILSIHDAFSVYTPHPCMFRSSLRWWETVWEGDVDGPAVCFGHAWTIWRAEAEFYYGLHAMDDDRLLDSYNGFMTNLSKTDSNGNMYSIYQYEPISSGALIDKGWQMDRSNREGFPKRFDTTLSRYAWARAADTWLNTVAILPGHILMAKREGERIIPQCRRVDRIYLGDVKGTFIIALDHIVEIVSRNPYAMEAGEDLIITVY